jgi:hypothetical protein
MHINGGNLKTLEAQLREIKNSITIIAINYVGTNWFIHFLAQSNAMDNVQTIKELAGETVTKTVKTKK